MANGRSAALEVEVGPPQPQGTGSFRGVSILEGDFGGGRQFGTCKYRFKRTSTADPIAQSCP